MNIREAIKVLLTQPGKIDAELITRLEQNAVDAEKLPQTLIEKYGDDFNAFFYRPLIKNILCPEVLHVLYPNLLSDDCLNQDHWNNKNPLNFPGPFYVGESDTCGTGIIEAIDNVMIDGEACEYIARQPKSYVELVHVMSAAVTEVLDTYSCNGNKYWTYNACKAWWATVPLKIKQLNKAADYNFGVTDRYIHYLNTDAELDLRRYCFFLLNNYYPAEDNLDLPTLS
jgi:hypothetical protein